MKDIVLTNFTRFDLKAIEELIVKYKLHNIWVQMPADGIDENTVRLINRYSLNLIIPVDCVEKGHNSIQNILERNPKFLEYVEQLPKGKVSFLRVSKNMVDGSSSIIAIARSFPENIVYNVRNVEGHCTYHEDMAVVEAYQREYEHQPELAVTNLRFMLSLQERFDVIDYSLLKTIGIIGVQECIVMQK